jgi:O-antigen ligase
VKWPLLIFAAAAVGPLSVMLRSNPGLRLKLFVLLGFLPFITWYEHYYMSVIDLLWIGYVRGAEISYLDLLALAIFLSLPGGAGRLPFRFAMASYFAATVLSAFDAAVPMAALFYSLQLARVFLLYATIYRGICDDPRAADAVLKGMAAGIFVEAALTIWQRFGLGVVQAIGTFTTQNHLGLTSHFVVIPFFALMLGGRRGWRPPAVVAAGLLVQVLTTSRGAIFFGGFGLILVFVLSASRQWTSRKSLILLMGVAGMAVFGLLAAKSFQERFGSDSQIQFADDEERVRFKEAAADMLADHPMGVGANHFTYAANMGGYFDRVGELWGPGRGTNVHNVYWLVAAETGYLGLAAFLFLFFRPLYVALACGLRNVGDPKGDLELGLGVALLVVYLHCLEEWIFVTFDTQYVFAIEIGLVAGLARRLGYWRQP